MTSLPQTHISKDQKEKELNDISISGGSGSIRISVPADIIKGVTENCWSPPPPPRQMQGDLLYLEIITASEGVMHVTATGKFKIEGFISMYWWFLVSYRVVY